MFPRGGQEKILQFIQRNFWQYWARSLGKKCILNLISAKCIPCLLYASEALSFNYSQLKSLGFPLKRILFKMFKTGSSDIVSQCQ